MNTTAALLNVVDVEATRWDGDPPPGQSSEVIEIGLTVVDLATGERAGRHRILVRPARSTVSPFRTELTGLTQAEVDTEYPFGHRHTNAKAVFTAAHGLRKRPGMAKAPRIAALIMRLAARGDRPGSSLQRPTSP